MMQSLLEKNLVKLMKKNHLSKIMKTKKKNAKIVALPKQELSMVTVAKFVP